MTAAISSFIPPVAPRVPTPAPAPAPQQGFARVLSQTQKNQQAAQERPQETRPHTTETRAPARAQEHRSERTQERAQERAKLDQKTGKGEKPAKAEKSEARAKRSADDETQKADAAPDTQASEAAPTDPALADWLSGLHLPPSTPHTATSGESGGDAPASDEAALQAALGGQRGQPGNGPHDATGRADHDAADRAQAVRELQGKPELKAADAVTQEPGWQAAMEHAKGQVEGLAEARPVHDAHGLGALAAASHAPSTARTGEAAPTVVSVPTPATAPEFAQSLGVQVSVLARDGVQQAELHLNPADMGPISVQIALDGTQAQVNFGADSAATRQIIEGGLPELAAALRDAGFTLSGGGVHSQARGRDEGGEGRGGNAQGQAGSGAIETDVTVRRSQARVSAGGLDVYA